MKFLAIAGAALIIAGLSAWLISDRDYKQRIIAHAETEAVIARQDLRRSQ